MSCSFVADGGDPRGGTFVDEQRDCNRIKTIVTHNSRTSKKEPVGKQQWLTFGKKQSGSPGARGSLRRRSGEEGMEAEVAEGKSEGGESRVAGTDALGGDGWGEQGGMTSLLSVKTATEWRQR